MSKGIMWGVVIIALLIGAFGGYYFEKTKMTSQMVMLQASMQKQMDDAKMKNTDSMMQENSPIMMANDPKLGSIVTDPKGMTLYTYDKDTQGQSNCTGQCAVNWPPFTVTGT